MRLKLVLLTSLLGAAIGAGVSMVLTGMWRHGISLTALTNRSDGSTLLMFYAPAIVIAVFAAFFIFRHTAYRRKFQASLTGLLTIALWLVAVATTYFVGR